VPPWRDRRKKTLLGCGVAVVKEWGLGFQRQGIKKILKRLGVVGGERKKRRPVWGRRGGVFVERVREVNM